MINVAPTRSLPNPVLASAFLAWVRDCAEDRDAEQAEQAQAEAAPEQTEPNIIILEDLER
jgi:hypothetical protein